MEYILNYKIDIITIILGISACMAVYRIVKTVLYLTDHKETEVDGIICIYPEKKAKYAIDDIINTLEINIASSKSMHRSMIVDLVRELAMLRPEEYYIDMIVSCIMFNLDKYGYNADSPILELLYKAIEIERNANKNSNR